jgi:hypothetical protein
MMRLTRPTPDGQDTHDSGRSSTVAVETACFLLRVLEVCHQNLAQPLDDEVDQTKHLARYSVNKHK